MTDDGTPGLLEATRLVTLAAAMFHMHGPLVSAMVLQETGGTPAGLCDTGRRMVLVARRIELEAGHTNPAFQPPFDAEDPPDADDRWAFYYVDHLLAGENDKAAAHLDAHLDANLADADRHENLCTRILFAGACTLHHYADGH